VLIDRAVQVGPPAGHIDVGLIDEPSVADDVPSWAGRINELAREDLHPAVNRRVIDDDAAFGQQVLDIAIGKAVAQYQRTARSPPREAGIRPERRRRQTSL
jgi:hypothetical protein